jgi:malate permease and related proteins
MQIVNSLAPVFLLIGLGTILVRSGFLQKDFLRGMNDLAYWIGLPSVIFLEISRAELGRGGFSMVLLVCMSGTLIALAGGLATAFLLRLPRASGGTFLQASFRGNLAFIGLPVVLFAFRDATAVPDLEKTLSAAVLVLAPMIIFFNVASVVALYSAHVATTGQLAKKVFRQLVTNPLIIASVAGLAAALLQVALPPFLDRSVEALSRMALPLALLCIGGSLAVVPVKGSLSAAFAAALIKVAVAPLGGLAVGLALGLDKHLLLVAVIYLACPTAAASYVLARQLGGDEALAASTVVVSTVLSLVSLSAAVAFL